MKRARVLIIGVLLIGSIVVWWLLPGRSHYIPGITASNEMPTNLRGLYSAVRDHFERLSRKPSDLQLAVTGTPGTPVVIGYELDRSRTGILTGITPTNFTIRGRYCVYCAVKNVGSNTARLNLRICPPMHSNPGGWKPPGFPRPDGFYPPFCGFYLQAEWSGGGGGTYGASDLGPGSWPETLPPGMTRRQAKAHDFAAEIHRARIRECQALLAANPTDQEALLEMAWAYRRRGEHAGAAAAFEKLLTTDCNDGSALNTFIWYYIEHGGTNLHCALRAARKAWDLGPQDAYLIDTIGWVFFKYGDYERALYMFKQIPGGSPDGNLDVLYRSGLAHYMTGDQREARRIFEPLKKGPQAVEIQKCLEVLDIQDPAPNAVSEAKLRARLAEVPDDPVALSRLAAMYEGVAEGQQAREPLVRKALGFTACHRSEYARALEYLKEAAQGRPEDGELFLVLGMVCQQLGQEKDAIQWLRKALSLKLKFSSRDQANEMLAPLTATGAQPAPASPE